MITFPNAKINIGLNIVSKRTDGYHNLETLFYPIKLRDIIEIQTLEDNTLPYTFKQQGIQIDGAIENNLIVKAYNLLKERYKLPPIEIVTYKAIPSGAGLGGGSADAAFMLKLLNDYFKLELTPDELIQIASSLGADCAFFIHNKPIYAEGIGNIFKEVSLDLSSYDIYIEKPAVFISTAEAFSKIVPTTPQYPILEAIKQPIEEWKKLIVNDFETSVFDKRPELATIKQRLYDKGAIYASMSGSGSSIYGIFRKGTCPFKENIKENKFLFTL